MKVKGSRMCPNMPPKRAAWHKDINEAKVIEKKQIKEKLSALLLFALKAGHTFIRKGASISLGKDRS